MATTTKTLIATAWVLVSAVGSGTMENQTGQIVLYRTDDDLPEPSVKIGHHLGREQREAWSFDPPQNLYARLNLPGSGALVVTEG